MNKKTKSTDRKIQALIWIAAVIIIALLAVFSWSWFNNRSDFTQSIIRSVTEAVEQTLEKVTPGGRTE